MLHRTGNEVLGSARRPDQPIIRPASQTGSQLADLPPRRRAAIKKAYKCIDKHGRGSVPLDEAFLALSSAPAAGQAGMQELRSQLERIATNGADGRQSISQAAFSTYYQNVSMSIANDGDFEKMLEIQWGSSDVSDILAAMQRQFARIGFMTTFKDYTRGERLCDMTPDEFSGCLSRIGFHPRADDLQRIMASFGAPGGKFCLQDFKEQIVAPRPETPPPSMQRDLAMPLGASGAASGQTMTPPVAQSAPGAQAAFNAQSSLPSGGPAASQMPSHDLDSHLQRMEAQLNNLNSLKVQKQAAPSQSPPRHPHLQHHEIPDGPISDADLDAALSNIESHVSHIKAHQAQQSQQTSPQMSGVSPQKPTGHHALHHHAIPDGPISDADLDAALSGMEGHLNHVKAHVPIAQQKHAPPPDIPPVDMPHWEHHKYDHHKITTPAWKPAETITDMYGHQHKASEYNYSNSGVGSHAHHLAHFHLNDYHGLAHHSFQQQEYHRQQYGDAAHHGHWVPHLHGIGTSSHHGEHAYGKEEYHQSGHGAVGKHGHFVPHLHGIGNTGGKS